MAEKHDLIEFTNWLMHKGLFPEGQNINKTVSDYEEELIESVIHELE